jgi:hypothetical protein
MRAKKAVLVLLAMVAAAAQSPDPPLSDDRLTVHTLVREDLFAGFLDNNMTRFSRGERSLQVLMEQRPAERANLLAWKAGADLYRAVLAHESQKTEEFQRQFQRAREGFAEAARLDGGNDGVAAITGGTLVLFADRLPAEHRAPAWAQAYDAYALLWKGQSQVIEKLPVHHRGEVLAGLAQAAQRTGRAEEAAQHVDRMLALLQGTPYERAAKEWKADPAAAAGTSLTCKTCHNPGRLSARLAALGKMSQ